MNEQTEKRIELHTKVSMDAFDKGMELQKKEDKEYLHNKLLKLNNDVWNLEHKDGRFVSYGAVLVLIGKLIEEIVFNKINTILDFKISELDLKRLFKESKELKELNGTLYFEKEKK
jgi:hypothetical protein